MIDYLTASFVIVLVTYIYLKLNYNYWSKKGVPGPLPVPLFGNFTGLFFKRLTAGEAIDRIYQKWKNEPIVGVYKGSRPQLIVNDLDLIKTILIKDFDTFHGRGNILNQDVDPLVANLFNIDGKKWKSMRTKFSPLFTSGKIKDLFDTVNKCADNFEAILKQSVEKNSVINNHDIIARYTTDIVGLCGYGIDPKALTNPDSALFKISLQIMESNFERMLKRILGEVRPKLFRYFKISVAGSLLEKDFRNFIDEIVGVRRNEKIKRDDWTNAIMEAREGGDPELDEDVMLAMVFGLYLAGFEMMATFIGFALWELAAEPEIQEKLRKEILETLKDNKGQLSHDIVSSMKYLDMVLMESLRKNPTLINLVRQTYEPYRIPGTNVVLEKGTRVSIPIYSIQNDPRYYPDPEKFDPERFTDEAKAQRHPMLFSSLGHGPKNCIGFRFAICPAKLCIMKILKNYKVKRSDKTGATFETDKGTIVRTPLGGIHLLCEPLD